MESVKTSGEVAQELGVSVSLIRKLENIGVTAPARRLNRFRVYTTAEVEELRKVIQERNANNVRRTVRQGVCQDVTIVQNCA